MPLGTGVGHGLTHCKRTVNPMQAIAKKFVNPLIDCSRSPPPAEETADFISRTALAAVVCLKTGANAGLLKIWYCSGAMVAQLCSSGVGVRSRRV